MFRICIPTAGLGSRLGEATRYLNKALISVSNRPAITHIIELLPDHVEIVIPLGYKGELVQEYLEFAHPRRSFIFEWIDPFIGSGSGLGATLLQVQHHLREPFLFSACDAITDTIVPIPDHNWVGYVESSDTSGYRTIRVENGLVVDILEKSLSSNSQSYLYCGVSGIKDVQEFWSSMNDGGDAAIDQGETYGLKALINLGLIPQKLEWFDIGTKTNLARTRDALAKKGPEPNVLEKVDEAIWFIGDKVIKYSNDTEFIRKRVIRARHLEGFVPQIVSTSTHMFSYEMARGQVLSSVINESLFIDLLNFAEGFWTRESCEAIDLGEFQKICMDFYKGKTFQRISQFKLNSHLIDAGQPINGKDSHSILDLLELVDWAWLADGIPVRFHGDFHFENILYDQKINNFTLVDWRQDFGGSLTVGDIHYDLAKLLHGLYVSHRAVVNNEFKVDWESNQIIFGMERDQVLRECEALLVAWINTQGLDCKKVYVITSLIFLNIAPLHHFPYSHFLYALGKSMLQKELGL